jgi:hypothetical protein
MDTEPRPPGCQCQWEAGDSLCPVHGEDEEEHARTLVSRTFSGAHLAALIARCADIRTLDDWVAGDPILNAYAVDGGSLVLIVDRHRRKFYGATPDEARAKAAAWVRKNTTPADRNEVAW